MLNEALYEGLIELGLKEEKAKKAASENMRIQQLCQDVAYMRKDIGALCFQSAEFNNRLLHVEEDVSVLKEDVSFLKKKVVEHDGQFEVMNSKLDYIVSLIKNKNSS